MSASIARYLKDFGAPPPQMVVEDLDAFAPDMSDFAAPAEEPVDIEAERAEAFARGRDEATAEIQARWDAERAGMIDAHKAEMAALQARFESEFAQMAAARLQEFSTSTARIIADRTAAALAPLAEETIVAKAIADLANLVRTAVLQGEVQAITVRGPFAMFDKFRDALGSEAAVIRHVEAVDIDLVVELGDASLVTRISEWAAGLRKVLG